jgi:hypothetical protein
MKNLLGIRMITLEKNKDLIGLTLIEFSFVVVVRDI